MGDCKPCSQPGAAAPMPPKDGPVHFAAIAKSAKDLIHKGFVGGHMLSIGCYGPCNSSITSSATMAHDITVGAMTASMSEGPRKHEISFSTLNNKISGTTTFMNACVPGMTIAVSSSIPGALNEGSINVQYQNESAALAAKIYGLKPRPEIELSVNVGSKYTFAGGTATLDTRSRGLGGSKLGFGYLCEATTATILYDPLVDKCVDAFFTRKLSAQTQVGAHLTRLIDKRLNSVKIGGSFEWDKQVMVKWRLDDRGSAAGLLQYTPCPTVTLGLAAAVNLKDLRTHPSVGLSLNVQPS